MVEDHMIRKMGLWYRPGAHGYTNSVIDAGLFTQDRAEREVAVEPQNISAHHVREFADELHDVRSKVEAKISVI